jgi:hypothetical protein
MQVTRQLYGRTVLHPEFYLRLLADTQFRGSLKEKRLYTQVREKGDFE